MGIVNRTPDSFYDRGAAFSDPAARQRVDEALTEGADVLDIGGVKAGPGDDVDAREERRRVVPFIAWIRETYPEAIISVDTWRAEVADAALDAGADLINDTWAGADPRLVDVAARRGAGLVVSHTGGAVPRTRPFRVGYDDVVADVCGDPVRRARAALDAGVPADGIFLDPTHDFGKNTAHGLELLRRVDELVTTGIPVLMALSRKDFLGEVTATPPSERLPATLAASALAAAVGVRMFRAHDVRATREALETVGAIVGTFAPRRSHRGLA